MHKHAQTLTGWPHCLGYALFDMRMKTLAWLVLLICVSAAPCRAASSASSAVSDSLATSVGSVSDSIKTSSDSSSQNKRVAEGNYKIIEIAQAPAGTLRLTLRAVADGAEFFLLLPPQTVAQNQLAAGHTVSVQHRTYGLQFSRAETGQAFFLALEGSSHRELQSIPLV